VDVVRCSLAAKFRSFAVHDSLISELRAIELWDHFYTLSDIHDIVDASAWSNRRERQSAIYKQLVEL